MKVIAKLSTRLFNSDAIRDAFVNGWVDAGGTTGDCESATPWCAPWYWVAVGPEVLALIEEEKAYCA